MTKHWKLNIEIREEGIPAEEVQVMNEAFLTGTSTRIMAIKEVDGYEFFNDECGPVTRQLQKAFLELKK